MAWFIELVDRVWPSIEPTDGGDAGALKARLAELRERWAAQPDDTVELLLTELRRLYDDEEDRRSRVEGKAASMLAAISLSISLGSGLLFAAVRAEFSSTASKYAALAAFAFALFSLIYLVTAARHALRAIERGARSALGPEEIVDEGGGNAATLKRRIAEAYGVSAIRNREPTNRKVESVHLAQLFVRNAVVAVVPAVSASFLLVLLAPVHDATGAAPRSSDGTSTVQMAPLPPTTAPSANVLRRDLAGHGASANHIPGTRAEQLASGLAADTGGVGGAQQE